MKIQDSEVAIAGAQSLNRQERGSIQIAYEGDRSRNSAFGLIHGTVGW